MADLKLKFKMPDDETLAEYISIKGEKGERGDPTRTSQLENDSDFTTNAALTAGLATKANATTVQALSSQVETNTEYINGIKASKIVRQGNAGANGIYFKLATLPPKTDEHSAGAINIHGRMGGYQADRASQLDITVVNRSSDPYAYGDLFYSRVFEYDTTDLVAYEQENGTVDVYLFAIGYYAVNFEMSLQGYCQNEYDGTYSTTQPSGTIVWKLSEDTNVQRNFNGIIMANIAGNASTVNEHTVESDVPYGAVFTDTVYDDSEIRTELDLKADIDNVSSTYATKQEVQSIASGSPLAASSTSEMTDTTRIYVNTTDGHWYYYDGSDWIDGGVYQSTVVSDGTVFERHLNSEFDKEIMSGSYKSIFETTDNLVYENDVKVGFYQYDPELVLFPNPNFFCLKLKVEPNTTYYINRLVHWYYLADEHMTKLVQKGSSGTDATDVTITTTDASKYLIVDFRASYGKNNIVITKGSSATAERLNLFLNPKILPSNQCMYVTNGKVRVDNGSITFPAGFIVLHNQSYASPAKTLTLDASLSEGVNVIVCNTLTRVWRIIGWKNINSQGAMGSIENQFHPEDAIVAVLYNKHLLINGGEYPDAVVNTKKIAFMGDSITAGNNCSKAYHMYLSNLTGMHCLNYGCGGTGYVAECTNASGKVGGGMEGVPSSPQQQYGNNTIGQIIDTVPSDVTNFVVFGGTNDYGSSVSMANFEDAVQDVINKLYARSAKMLFFTPIRRYNSSSARSGETPNSAGLKLSDYVNKIIEVCNANGVPYVELYNNIGLNPVNATNNSLYYSDGLHPKNAGHQMLARKLITHFESYFTRY